MEKNKETVQSHLSRMAEIIRVSPPEKASAEKRIARQFLSKVSQKVGKEDAKETDSIESVLEDSFEKVSHYID
ncbi:MAG TPA: hypothetical protein ENK14_09315, partial [Caldithrix sp.]|nr:hypothetical protein [Caldithrix sp.]